MTETSVRFPAEWEPQSAILIAWPHAGTDWADRLGEVEETYLARVQAITRFQPVLICVADDDIETYAEMRLRSNRVATTSNELLASLSLARTEAIRGLGPAGVCPSAAEKLRMRCPRLTPSSSASSSTPYTSQPCLAKNRPNVPAPQ